MEIIVSLFPLYLFMLTPFCKIIFPEGLPSSKQTTSAVFFSGEGILILPALKHVQPANRYVDPGAV